MRKHWPKVKELEYHLRSEFKKRLRVWIASHQSIEAHSVVSLLIVSTIELKRAS